MTCYIATFEVANVQDKNALIERLKAYGTYCPINDNCWAIVTEQTAAQVRQLTKYLLSSLVSRPPGETYMARKILIGLRGNYNGSSKQYRIRRKISCQARSR